MSNTKDIKDYLHFYLGCPIAYNGREDFYGTLMGLELPDTAITWNETDGRRVWNVKALKPILRPLNSMTEEETAGMPDNSMHISAYKEGIFYHPKLFRYLLSLHFDLFDLINSGIALEKQQEVKK